MHNGGAGIRHTRSCNRLSYQADARRRRAISFSPLSRSAPEVDFAGMSGTSASGHFRPRQLTLSRAPPSALPQKLTSSPNGNLVAWEGCGRRLSELPCQFGGLLFAGVDHIDSAVIPRMFERKHHDFPDADES
jgi:hypothetical protein